MAFCTQNIVPGIDQSNDPLLQGRNFSYLDTQLKRLGGPNFTHIPVNAPRCPVRHFQQDGHMAMTNPKGRANYEPNSWGPGTGEDAGPRENPQTGFNSYPEEIQGSKLRARPESFADHYSQAGQFYRSQTPTEQTHMGNALVFELSKVQRSEIRARMVGHLRNIDDGLAQTVADGLGMAELPDKLKAASDPIADLPESPALSILKNGPDNFKGRKLGIYIAEGGDAATVEALRKAAKDAGAMCEIIAPHVSGAKLSDGTMMEADEKIDGGPSVVYDAVAIVMGEQSGETFAKDKPSQDFVSDAFAHAKFIAYTGAAMPLFKAVGIDDRLDGGCIELGAPDGAAGFIETCGKLRFWDREAVKQD